MTEFQLTTPVVFIIFNRVVDTQRIFAEIRKAKPQKLFVIADGPRVDRPSDIERCAITRDIIESVDWDCEVFKNYSEINLGCGKRIASGLDWVFDRVEEAIIIEDDCMPDQSFFPFCQELLERYRDDGRVMSISGNNFQFGHQRTDYSYYFSKYSQTWGWATWGWVWKKYFDLHMSLWPQVRDSRGLFDIFGHVKIDIKNEETKPQVLGGVDNTKYWYGIFEDTYAGEFNTWAYPFFFSCLVQHGVHILPSVNLVSNIGFGPEATHTTCVNCFANVPIAAMNFPLKHPAVIIPDAWADEYLQALKAMYN